MDSLHAVACFLLAIYNSHFSPLYLRWKSLLKIEAVTFKTEINSQKYLQIN